MLSAEAEGRGGKCIGTIGPRKFLGLPENNLAGGITTV